MNKHSLQIALAYMSVVIGGGFASGNEVLQFFTGYGLAGIAGSVVAAVLWNLMIPSGPTGTMVSADAAAES